MEICPKDSDGTEKSDGLFHPQEEEEEIIKRAALRTHDDDRLRVMHAPTKPRYEFTRTDWLTG